MGDDKKKLTDHRLFSNYREYDTLKILTYILFFIFAILAIRYQVLLLNYKEWGDESETIVAAKMIASGMRLYSEIFNHHGPLTFLTGLLVEKIGGDGIRQHRLPIAALQICSIIAIYKSPIVRDKTLKICISIFAATIMLAIMPIIWGHVYQYQTIAGLLLIIILSQYVLLAILVPVKLKPFQIVLGNVLIACLPFLSITYLPLSIILCAVAFRRESFSFLIVGIFLGLLLNCIFLGLFGSFEGYLAFHIYLNAKILPIYSGVQPGTFLALTAFNVATSDFSHFLALIIMFIVAGIMSSQERGFPKRTVFLMIGVGSLLMRGAGLHGMPFFYSLLALMLPLFFSREHSSRQTKYVAVLFILICIVKVSLFLPGNLKQITSKKIPLKTEFSELVREFTHPTDRIIAYSFNNFEYIASDRLPASGNFFYLPWQEKYNENPKFGIQIDACKEISIASPKVMLINKWKVWDRFSWDSYAGCIQNILDKKYVQYLDKPYYIRKDLMPVIEWLEAKDSGRTLTPSLMLNESESIPLKFVGSEIAGNKKLLRLGVMFATYNRKNLGKAQLILKRINGSDLKVLISLSDLEDNKYRYFSIPEDYYETGLISFFTGGGISTWESRGEKNSLTCIKYWYADGSRGFTPGCPLF